MADAAISARGASEATPGGAVADGSLLGILGEVWRELPGLLNDRVELLSLELNRAGLALVKIVVLTVAGTILGLTAWLVLWALLLVVLTAAGAPLVWGLTAALLVNIAAAAWAMAHARRLLPLLSLPVTRRHLTIGPSPTPRAARTETQPDGHPPSPQPVSS